MSSARMRFARPFRNWLAQPVSVPATPPEPTHAGLPILVVGAGPAGLAAMVALREAKVEFEAVESHSQIGGIWDMTNPLSSTYEGLCTVTSRYTSQMGTPIPKDWPTYLPHERVLEYFIQHAETNHILRHIQLSTRFVDAVKTERGTWLVTLQKTDRDETEQAEYRGIVFATGSHNKLHKKVPKEMWDQAVAAGMQVLHSADYKSPEAFAGKRVMVIGVGNSGTDIAEKISAVSARMLLSVRTMPWINPPTMFGTPCDKLAADSRWMPDWLGMPVFHFGRRLVIGSFRRLGLRRPTCRLNDRIPTTDRGIVRAIRNGTVVTRSEAIRFENGMAYFADERHPAEPVDAVIFATGFARRYPLLEQEVCDGEGPLFQLFHRTEPGLAYQTEMVGLRSCWPIFVEQAKAIAAYFVAEGQGNSHIDELNRRRLLPTPNCKGKLFRLGNQYHVDYPIYTRLVSDLARWLSAGEPRPRIKPPAELAEKIGVGPRTESEIRP